MRYEDLSQYDQELLNTDLGEFEKEATEKLAEANEVYAYGQQQAHAIADEMDYAMAKHAEEEEEGEEEEEEEMDEESEKKAAELGAFIERGLFDELIKLGSERHGDPLHYYYPYMEEKVAQIGAEEKLAAWYHELGKKVKDVAGKAKEKIIDYHRGIGKNLSDMRTGDPRKVKVKNPGKKGPKTKMMETTLTPGERVKSGLTAGAKMLPHAALLGGAGYGTYRAFSGKKKK